MTRERLYLFDTTLRDGAQTTGVDFSLDDKRDIAAMLDRLGIDYVEGGYPGANPLDTQVLRTTKPSPTREVHRLRHDQAGRALGRQRPRHRRAARGAMPMPSASSPRAGTTMFHVALETHHEENLAGIRDSIAAARDKGREVLLDCEHFFDGYKANPDYALDCARAAYEAGARWVVLCDTNGGTLPHEIGAIVREVARVVPGDHLGIHAHDDCGYAVANSLAAVEAGARQIQGTLNGLGERCGNANLVTLIGALRLKDQYADRFDLGVMTGRCELTHLSRRSTKS